MKSSSPSATAGLIARSTVLLSQEPRFGHLVSTLAAETSAKLLRALSPLAAWALHLLKLSWIRALIFASERLTIPGLSLHYALRNRYLEDLLRARLKVGIHQVVIVGAGFDTLAWRLHQEFRHVTFFEVDHPATQVVKGDALAERRQSATSLNFVPVDLSAQSPESRLLQNPAFRRSVPTFFVAEGITTYLTGTEVTDLFGFVRDHAGAGSRLAFTFMEPTSPRSNDRQPRVRFRNSTRLVDWWLRLRNEPFRWGLSREDLDDFLSRQGFSLHRLAASETLRSRYLTPHGLAEICLAEGEYVCTADPVVSAA